MGYKIELEEIAEPRPLAVVRRCVRREELPKTVTGSCGLVWNALREAKIKGAGRHVAVFLDNRVNVEVGVEMDGPFDGCGEVVASSIPLGLVASAAHIGPYQKLHEAHRAIQGWAAANGYALAGPNWEIYGHWVDEWNNNPSKIRTDVFYLLKPKIK